MNTGELLYPSLPERRLVIVDNPEATHAFEPDTDIDDITENTCLRTPVRLQTSLDEEVQEKEFSKIEEGDIVYVRGGDYTHKQVGEFLARSVSPQAIMMTSRRGNACNIHASAVAAHLQHSPSETLKRATIAETYPLHATVTGPEEYSEFVLTILSAGKSMALGAGILEHPDHRNRRKWIASHLGDRAVLCYEKAIVLSEILPRIRTVEIGNNGDTCFEVIVANAGSVAKEAHFPTEIDELGFVVSTIRNLRQGWQLAKGKQPVEFIKHNQTIRIELADTPRNRGTWIQFDGNAKPFEPGSIVDVQQIHVDDGLYRPLKLVMAA